MYCDKKQIGGFLVDEEMGRDKTKGLQKGTKTLLGVTYI